MIRAWANTQMGPSRPTVRRYQSPRRAAHLQRWAAGGANIVALIDRIELHDSTVAIIVALRPGERVWGHCLTLHYSSFCAC